MKSRVASLYNKKILIVIGILYILFLLSYIAYNTGNGRYQTFGDEHQQILDTRTGHISDPIEK